MAPALLAPVVRAALPSSSASPGPLPCVVADCWDNRADLSDPSGDHVMAHILECSNGHRWGDPTPDESGRCPVCGARALVPVASGEPGPAASPDVADTDAA